MSRLTESVIEDFAIKLFERLGYFYEQPERENYSDVLLIERLQSAINHINPTIPESARQQALKDVERIHSPELLANNETFHRMLTEGVKVTYQKDGHERGDSVMLIDFDNPENNEFLVVNQFTVIENHLEKRPDVILFVNGLPFARTKTYSAVWG